MASFAENIRRRFALIEDSPASCWQAVKTASGDPGIPVSRGSSPGQPACRLCASNTLRTIRFWLASTQSVGLFASRDCGITFENFGNIGVGTNIYDIAFDSGLRGRIALAVWGTGVVVSEDEGKTWHTRSGLPSSHIWSVAFDPAKPGRLFASVHEEAIYVSDDAGKTWTRDGVEGSIVHRMKFIPETAVR